MWELLAPAGSYESMIAAVNAGADAVYVGGRLFGARAYADNPDEEQLIRGLEYCHLHGRKLYLTVNTLLKERELDAMLGPYLQPYYENGVDGLIVQDFGVVRYVKEHFPGLPVHASTQMTVTGADGVRLLQSEGISRVVLARELSLTEIRSIIEETGAEVETFIHGAMCYSYSGQCLFSSLLGGRSGNRGRCAQPCRLPYEVLQDARGSTQRRQSGMETAYFLSMKDMCTIDFLPELLDAGIASLKIEGRMKRPEYTAGVVSVYRKYIDLYREVGNAGYRVEEEDRRMLLDLYNRGGFSEGYYHVHNGRSMMALYRPNHRGTEAVRVSTGKGGRKKLTALEPLGRGDVLELSSGEEFTLGEDIQKGELVRLPSPGRIRTTDGVLYRTKNAGLLLRLKQQYLDKELREKVNGELVVSADGRAVLRLTCQGASIECAQQIGEPAQNQPASLEAVQRQMRKTGNTPFEFDELNLSLAEGLFLPVAGLNELRRTGLELLRRELLAQARRGRALPEAVEARPCSSASGPQAGAGKQDAAGAAQTTARRNVLVTTKEQLEAVLASDFPAIDTVYLDSMIFALLQPEEQARRQEPAQGIQCQGDRQDKDGHSPEQDVVRLLKRVRDRGWRCFLNCPEVLRERERAFLSGPIMRKLMPQLDGFLLHTLDELAFFQDYIRENRPSAVLAADENLYAYNRRAAGFLYSQGVVRLTFPAELNFHELRELKAPERELVVYGYQALMRSAQCVKKNTSGCSGRPGLTWLKDRKHASFPVLNRCPFCTNTVYNSVPLMLCGCQKELARLAPSYVRLSFTVESGEETARVLEQCRELLDGADYMGKTENAGNIWTKGHFKRGVE